MIGVPAFHAGIQALDERFLPPRLQPRDAWERGLLDAADRVFD